MVMGSNMAGNICVTDHHALRLRLMCTMASWEHLVATRFPLEKCLPMPTPDSIGCIRVGASRLAGTQEGLQYTWQLGWRVQGVMPQEGCIMQHNASLLSFSILKNPSQLCGGQDATQGP